MRRTLAGAVLAAGVIGAVAFWVLSAPRLLGEETIASLGDGNPEDGERIFWAGGCASCHARPGAEGEAGLELAGGLKLVTSFGTFTAPNISQDTQDGIGGWSASDFANAMMRGVAPDGAHLYPSFPYTSYARMRPDDIGDLYAFMKTLPAVSGKAPGHELAFPFNIRRGLGLWKQLYLSDRPVIALPPDAPYDVVLGRYLVEGPGHCGECHTPRGFFGGPENARWLSGAVAAEKGEGVVPNITPGGRGIGSWSVADIASYLETGFTPEFDSVGGSMVDVQRNMARLRPEDREAIAAYLKAVPAHEDGFPAASSSPE